MSRRNQNTIFSFIIIAFMVISTTQVYTPSAAPYFAPEKTIGGKFNIKANGYEVYRKENGSSFQKVTTITNKTPKKVFSYKDASLLYDSDYAYKFKPFTKTKKSKTYGKTVLAYATTAPSINVSDINYWGKISEGNKYRLRCSFPEADYVEGFELVFNGVRYSSKNRYVDISPLSGENCNITIYPVNYNRYNTKEYCRGNSFTVTLRAQSFPDNAVYVSPTAIGILEKWKTSFTSETTSEKMQDVSDYATEVLIALGVTSRPIITIKNMPQGYNGNSAGDKNITISNALITGSDGTKLAKTLTHELRHVYQYYISQREDNDYTRRILHDYENYVDGTGTDTYESYAAQFVETDAREYAELVLNTYEYSIGEGNDPSLR